MDMWPAFIGATRAVLPEADTRIAFDKFHVAKYLGDAVDKVRRAEHKALRTQGRDDLMRSKYLWLRNPANMSRTQWRDFKGLRESTLRTARAWAIKAHLWGILNAILLGANNGGAESSNGRIQLIKVRGRGFRYKERFRNAISFHLGRPDLYPDAAKT